MRNKTAIERYYDYMYETGDTADYDFGKSRGEYEMYDLLFILEGNDRDKDKKSEDEGTLFDEY